MQQFVKQSDTLVRLCWKKRKHCLSTLLIRICYMNFRNTSKTSICYKNCTVCSERISYQFKSFRLSTRRYMFTYYKWVNLCSSAMLPLKKKFSIPTSKEIRSCSYMYISSKTLIFFNLTFQMKCKYGVMKIMKSVLGMLFYLKPKTGFC